MGDLYEFMARERARRPRLVVAERPAAPVVPPPAPPREVQPVVELEGSAPVIITEHPDTHRVVVTSPVHEAAAARSNPSLLSLTGRLVRAEQANRNGALWTKGDLEFGMPTVAYGPLNYQHEVDKVLGTLLAPKMVESADAGPHIETDAVVWRWVHAAQVAELAKYLGEGKAWLSMECVAERVQCTGPNGCDAIMPYREAALKTEKACVHVRERSAHRRMVNPQFQGAAVVLPPSRPAWADADLTLRQQTEDVLHAESAQVNGMRDDEAAAMVATILEWSGRAG